MVASSIQNLPAFVDSGQHSIVTAPADTGPSPRMRNLTLRGSGSTSFLPAPVVALSCNGLRTLIIGLKKRFHAHPRARESRDATPPKVRVLYCLPPRHRPLGMFAAED